MLYSCVFSSLLFSYLVENSYLEQTVEHLMEAMGPQEIAHVRERYTCNSGGFAHLTTFIHRFPP